jgi:hypothetical protein
MAEFELDEWITVREAARLTTRNAVTIRRWAREALIRSSKSGGVWLLRKSDVVRAATDGPNRQVVSLAEDPQAALHQAWRRVSKDLERDDLPDVVEHIDFGAAAANEIAKIAQSMKGGYIARPIRLVEMPKSLLLSRPLVDLAIEDRVVYDACVSTLAHAIDAEMHDRVYSHRLKKKPTPAALTRYFAHAYRDFDEYTRREAWAATGARSCLITDLASFYEYVDHRTLIQLLSEEFDQDEPVRLLGRLLNSWRAQASVVGLPQGPTDASGILSNAYLRGVDSVCAGHALAYARYGDDMRIFFADADDAARFAPRLIRALREIALNLSSAKTRIAPVEELASDDKGARRAAISYSVEIESPVSLDELRDLFDESTADLLQVDSIDFRFSVWRLGLIEDTYPLNRILEAVPFVPFAANIISDYLYRLGYMPEVSAVVADYLLSPNNVHEWTEIQFLRLIGTFDDVPAALLDRIRHLAFDRSGLLGDFAARVLGAVGTGQDRARLRRLSSLPDADPRRRRSAILGAGDVPAAERSWVADLAEKAGPPEVVRSAKYVAKGAPVPATLNARRTPPWVLPLRKRLLAEGRLPARFADEE